MRGWTLQKGRVEVGEERISVTTVALPAHLSAHAADFITNSPKPHPARGNSCLILALMTARYNLDVAGLPKETTLHTLN